MAPSGCRVGWTAVSGTLAATLYRFPPAQYHFYPVCPIHACTGLLCPGCGATRALAAMLHGHFNEALHLNAFFVLIIVPCALFYLGVALRRGYWTKVPTLAVYTFAFATALFTVARNL